ncbi:1793_t:CDS:2, partial [Dentiscutata heterogama]
WLLDQVKAGHLIQDLKINILQAIQFAIRGWEETDEFLMLNDKNIVYEVFSDDQIIKELAYIFKKDDSVESANKNITEIDDEDDSIETIT